MKQCKDCKWDCPLSAVGLRDDYCGKLRNEGKSYSHDYYTTKKLANPDGNCVDYEPTLRTRFIQWLDCVLERIKGWLDLE